MCSIQKYLAPLFILFVSFSSFSTVIPAGGFGANNNFIDNGVITTEYRSDGTVWQWLDLTVTNGISAGRIKADLNDDGILNNSASLSADPIFIADVIGLSNEQARGWQLAESNSVVAMLSGFFDESLMLFTRVNSYTNEVRVESFINLFGDTYHEFIFNNSGLTLSEWQARDEDGDGVINGSEIGWVRGVSFDSQLSRYYQHQIFDGELSSNTADFPDRIGYDGITDANRAGGIVGSWLTRQVVTVPEPSTSVMLLASILFLLVRTKQVDKAVVLASLVFLPTQASKGLPKR